MKKRHIVAMASTIAVAILVVIMAFKEEGISTIGDPSDEDPLKNPSHATSHGEEGTPSSRKTASSSRNPTSGAAQDAARSSDRRPAYANTLSEALETTTPRKDDLSPESKHTYSQWLEPCNKAIEFEGMSKATRQQLGMHSEQLAKASGFCQDALPDGHSLSDSMDGAALRQLSQDFFLEGSAASTSDRLGDTAKSRSSDAATREALTVLRTSTDEGALWAAVDFLVRSEQIEAPFAQYPASRQMFDPQLQESVVLALLCDRFGGCFSDHPLTLRHCIESTYGCLEPTGYFDAVRQTTPPLEYEAFLSLYDQIKTLIARSPD